MTNYLVTVNKSSWYYSLVKFFRNFWWVIINCLSWLIIYCLDSLQEIFHKLLNDITINENNDFQSPSSQCCTRERLTRQQQRARGFVGRFLA